MCYRLKVGIVTNTWEAIHVEASNHATMGVVFRGERKDVTQDEISLCAWKKGGSSMSLRAVKRYVQPEFSEIVDWFLARYCTVGKGLSISDKTLFPVFRTFWTNTAIETQHPALLGQFRVELAQRGFRSNGAKRPRWYGLTLHQLTLTLLKDQCE